MIGPDTEYKLRSPGDHPEIDTATIPIDSVDDHPDNPQIHPERQLSLLRQSYRQHDQVQAVVVQDRGDGRYTLVAGHGFTAAARAEGARALVARVIPPTWSPERVKAYMIADNILATLSAPDQAAQDALIAEIERATAGTAAAAGIPDDEIAAAIRRSTSPPDADPATSIGSLAGRFIAPPFSVLDSRQGYWRDRKAAWLSLGLQSELGRGDPDVAGRATNGRAYGQDIMRGEYDGAPRHPLGGTPISKENIPGYYYKRGRGLTDRQIMEEYLDNGGGVNITGTSIFDPVLTEILVAWYSAPGAVILDPFAGGSVRGIVAAVLGRHYRGVDLRPEQVEANRAQAAAILPSAAGDTVAIKVSAKMARLEFNGCDPDYIRDVCKAACCRSSTQAAGIMVTIHPTEADLIADRGGIVIDNLLQPAAARPGRCPFQADSGLCDLHGDPAKPFGCIASPFTLNKNGTLIVRNRYRLLKCFKDGRRLPAYVAFRTSLDLIMGADEAARVCAHLDGGGDDIVAHIPRSSYDILIENDQIKKGHPVDQAAATGSATWQAGDALTTDLGGPVDYVLTCPPYYNLERYSDDPADLSNYPDYNKFLEAYRLIIARAVDRLRPDRFASIVVGDLRRSDGAYHNFVSDTIAAVLAAGCDLYNEAVLINATGSLAIRAGRQFAISRKLGKTHQNVLTFVKGDGRRAAEYCGPVAVGDLAVAGEDDDGAGEDQLT